MPAYAINIKDVEYVLPVLNITLAPVGQDKSVANVTSRLKPLTEDEFALLQVEQDEGNVKFSATDDVTFKTGTLKLR